MIEAPTYKRKKDMNQKKKKEKGGKTIDKNLIRQFEEFLGDLISIGFGPVLAEICLESLEDALFLFVEDV